MSTMPPGYDNWKLATPPEYEEPPGEEPPDDQEECPNCGGEGYVYDCQTEYACVDPESGCDLCERRCDWCNSKKRPEAPQKAPDGVCVDDLSEQARLACRRIPYPIKGECYTIAAMEPSLRTGEIYIVLAELPTGIKCHCRGLIAEPSFHHMHFRPLEHSGMSILREIAENPKPIPGEHIPAPREVEKV